MSPNRVVLIATAVANITAALLPSLTGIGATQLIAPVAGLNAAALMFLKGWQQWEGFEARDLLHDRSIQREAAAQEEARARATGPASRVKLPR